MSAEMLGPILQGVFFIAFAPVLTGWINWLKSSGQGRKRHWAYIFQPYLDLKKLLNVPAVRPQTASWVFGMTPYIMFTAYAWLTFTIPIFSQPLLKIDVIVVIYVLGLARFILSLAGWDAGASFGGLGSSRQMVLYFLTEIGLFLVLVALALRWDTLDLADIIKNHSQIPLNILISSNSAFQDLGLIFLPIAFAMLVLFETEYISDDNPETHLELTMAQKAIILEFAGRDLALIKLAEMTKLMFLFALFSNLFFPLHNFMQANLGLSIVGFVIETILLGSLLALWELHHPKTRLRQVSRLAGGSILFSLITIVLVTITRI